MTTIKGSRRAVSGQGIFRLEMGKPTAGRWRDQAEGTGDTDVQRPPCRLEINTINKPSRDSCAKMNKILLFTKEPRLDITRRVESASDYTERVNADVPSLNINTVSPIWGPWESVSNLYLSLFFPSVCF
ncbi:hypothetical protein DPX16_9099 [Anabarilius grahami]|uniref:Uncharacterized protein n=1 Tax=Anabarilius grahami TaxID=495550 RepID=A0A3N0YJS0_ANAGA|nr:hypothetical protein DPX16_9099 [Anabarilius grahami]